MMNPLRNGYRRHITEIKGDSIIGGSKNWLHLLYASMTLGYNASVMSASGSSRKYSFKAPVTALMSTSGSRVLPTRAPRNIVRGNIVVY